MKLLEDDLKSTKPVLCEIQRDYIKYMHDADWRVSVKYNNRKFVGLPACKFDSYRGQVVGSISY